MKKRSKPRGRNDWVKKLKPKAIQLDTYTQRKELKNDQRGLSLPMCY
jgi:hypothetical protein